MTYSILGWAANGDLGVAVQSRFPGVGSLVPYGRAEVGVVATQGFGNPRHGTDGLTLLGCGATPQQAVDVLVGGDPAGLPTPVRARRPPGRGGRPHRDRPARLGRLGRGAPSAAAASRSATGSPVPGVAEDMVATFEELDRVRSPSA